MSKPNPKELAVTEVDPRVRMKEIRRIIAKAIKNHRRIDRMIFNDDDKIRVMIALQDLVNHEKDRHAKANKHILEYKEMIVIMTIMLQLVSKDSVDRMAIDQKRVDQVDQKNDQLRNAIGIFDREIDRLEDINQQLKEENHQLGEENDIITSKLASAMHTVKIMSEGVNFD